MDNIEAALQNLCNKFGIDLNPDREEGGVTVRDAVDGSIKGRIGFIFADSQKILDKQKAYKQQQEEAATKRLSDAWGF